MKKYYELLGEFIDNSEFSLTKLGEKLKEKGFSTDKSYLSRLRNGKTPPAGEDLNKAIAELTGNISDELIFLAYIEKSPDTLKQYIEDAFSLEKALDLEIAFSIHENDSFLLGNNRIVDFLNEKGIENYTVEEKISTLNILEKWEFLKLLETKTTLLNIRSIPNPLENFIDVRNYSNSMGNKIPLYKIVYGNGFYLEGDYEGTILAENINEPENVIAILVPDDQSLNDLEIRVNDIAIIEITNEFDEENIFLVSYQNGPAHLRKIQLHGEYLFLRPLNSSMKVEVIDKDKANIIGKLLEVRSSRKF